jgi:hypothetical protein
MTTRHSQRFSRSSFPLLLREYGETAIYYPLAVTGNARTIQVIIERNVEVQSETGDVSRAITCRALDDSTLGISAAEIDDGRDEIALALIPGGATSRRTITHMIDNANGIVRFMVR